MPYDMGNVKGDPVPWFERSLDIAGRLVAGVRDDQWGDATPCTEWNVRDLVHHLVGNNVWYAGVMRGDDDSDGPPQDDLLGDDPAAAYDASMDAAKEALRTPGCMERVMPFWGGVTGQLFTAEHFIDCFVHGWDLAKATGQNTALPRDLVEAAYAILEPDNGQPPIDEVWDFVDVAERAEDDLQTRLLARAGRVA
ncbi:MAG: TIGR03086 family protein [Dehalococcoidia bacterium]|nr:TIGR03086 family protein [Dehalococcoidia bacterium]